MPNFHLLFLSAFTVDRKDGPKQISIDEVIQKPFKYMINYKDQLKQILLNTPIHHTDYDEIRKLLHHIDTSNSNLYKKSRNNNHLKNFHAHRGGIVRKKDSNVGGNGNKSKSNDGDDYGYKPKIVKSSILVDFNPKTEKRKFVQLILTNDSLFAIKFEDQLKGNNVSSLKTSDIKWAFPLSDLKCDIYSGMKTIVSSSASHNGISGNGLISSSSNSNFGGSSTTLSQQSSFDNGIIKINNTDLNEKRQLLLTYKKDMHENHRILRELLTPDKASAKNQPKLMEKKVKKQRTETESKIRKLTKQIFQVQSEISLQAPNLGLVFTGMGLDRQSDGSKQSSTRLWVWDLTSFFSFFFVILFLLFYFRLQKFSNKLNHVYLIKQKF